MQYTVGISDMKVSNNPQDILVTYSLGSCIGVALFDQVAGIGGLIHCMLPVSKIDPNRAKQSPYMFTDVGVPTMIQAMLDLGATKKNIVAKVAGAAKLLDDKNTFRIGDRNKVVLRKVLWKNNILIAAEETGGSVARTMFLNIQNGTVLLKSQGRQYLLE